MTHSIFKNAGTDFRELLINYAPDEILYASIAFVISWSVNVIDATKSDRTYAQSHNNRHYPDICERFLDYDGVTLGYIPCRHGLVAL